MTKKQLLLDGEEEDDDEKRTSSSSSSHQLQINTKYATEYERRKRLEELQNSKDFLNDTDDDDDSESTSSEEEDEDAILSTPHLDVQILKTIRAIRTKDSIIYDPHQTFFPSTVENTTSSTTTTRKVKRYKDVVRETMLEKMNQDEGEHDDGDESDLEEDALVEKHRFAYDDEQETLRAAFLNSVQDDEGEDDLLQPTKPKKEDVQLEESIQKEMEALVSTSRRQEQSSLTLVDPRGEIEDGEGFLLDYIKNKKWLDTTTTTTTTTQTIQSEDGKQHRLRHEKDEEDDDSSHQSHDSVDSLQELDKTDAFESKYNFRFEEVAAATTTVHGEKATSQPLLVGYSRTSLSDTLRRKEDARKLKREQRKEKKMAERKTKEERLKRLKNAKREEMEHRVKQIKSVLKKNWIEGQEEEEEDDDLVDENILLKLLDGDYDAENFDQLMNKAFGDRFYEKTEEEWKTDKDVQASYMDDPEYRDAMIGEEEEELEKDDNGGDYYDEEDGDYGEDEDGVEKTALEQRLDSKIEEELYKLDYEDIIDDLPTRFKYRSVEANNYGLTAEEILLASDSTLKQYVSLKKMAPYAEEPYNPGSKRRKRFRELLHKERPTSETESKDHVDSTKLGNAESSMEKHKKRRQKKRKRNVDMAAASS